MQLSVEEVLKLPLLAPARLLTHTAPRRPVRWVSVIEAPVDDFVREDELVLTTAMGCDHLSPFRALVLDIARHNASALAIATGYYVRTVPDEVIQAAEARGLPLIELPWEIRFSEIAQAVSDALMERRLRVLEVAKDLQADVWSVIFQRGTAADLAAVLERRIERCLLLTGPDGRPLAAGARATASLVARYQEYRDTDSNRGVLAPDCCDPPADIPVAAVPIRSAGALDGYVVIPRPDAEELGAELLAEVADAASLWFLHQQPERSSQLRSRDALLWSLAYGERDAEALTEHLAVLGYRQDRHYLAVLGQADNLEEVVAPGRTRSGSDARVTIRQQIYDQLAAVVASLGQPPLFTRREDTFLIYLDTDPLDRGKMGRQFLESLDERLQRLLPRLVMSWGVGIGGDGPATFQKGFFAAQEALTLGYRQTGPGHRTYSSDLRAYRLLLQLSAELEAQHLMEDVLQPLRDYDDKRQGALEETLSTFIQTRGQVSETARLLNLHRQSLMYRLGKIESLTGRSLDNADNWFLFSLALRLKAACQHASAGHGR
jgi:purine catabolism regulator